MTEIVQNFATVPLPRIRFSRFKYQRIQKHNNIYFAVFVPSNLLLIYIYLFKNHVLNVLSFRIQTKPIDFCKPYMTIRKDLERGRELSHSPNIILSEPILNFTNILNLIKWKYIEIKKCINKFKRNYFFYSIYYSHYV